MDIKELDTIKSEHNFMRVGDPVPVNNFDDHESHIIEHTKELESLSNDEQAVFIQHYIDLLTAHIKLHEEVKTALM